MVTPYGACSASTSTAANTVTRGIVTVAMPHSIRGGNPLSEPPNNVFWKAVAVAYIGGVTVIVLGLIWGGWLLNG